MEENKTPTTENVATEIKADSPVLVPQSPVPVPAENLIDIDYLSKLELRVAKILSAEALPKSNKLLKLQISLGAELGERQILAGVAKHYTPESLVGRKIIVVANLKPAKLMGEISNGMLLAADAGEKVVLLNPEQDTPEGSRVR